MTHRTKTKAQTVATLSREDVHEIVCDAYTFGYPLVMMDVTRQVMTAVPHADEHSAPVNQFMHAATFPDDTFTNVVGPNADTLYSSAWLNLAKEPIVLSVPDVGGRYYLMPMLDAWTNVFASPGSRTTGNGPGHFAITGPRWAGTLPSGVHAIASPTNMAWLIGRTQTNGKGDYAAVHAIQRQYRLTPLSAWGGDYRPPQDVPVPTGIDRKTPPSGQVGRMDAVTFFRRLNRLMSENPPAAADAPALKRFATIGIAPGKPFDLNNLDPVVAYNLGDSARAAQARIVGEAMKPHGLTMNGWSVLPDNTARFGVDYAWRAVVALVGLGANLPYDAVYPHATEDANGETLTGAHRYVMRFREGQLPPVRAFWSVTMYNSRQAFVGNSLKRYAIGDRDPLTFGVDGSLTLYIQHESPGKDKESNWLPSPADRFNLFMRLYWPRREAISGGWIIPAVERVR